MAEPETRVADLSDRSLLRRFRIGQNEAATELYVRYASRLMALAKSKTASSLSTRFDPEDVVQSVFRTFFRRAAAGLYEVPPGDQLWQLFLVLALNKVRALGVYHRAKKRDVSRTKGSANIEAYSGVTQEGPLQVLSLVIEEITGQLPEVQQQMIQLRIEGYELTQIAERTDRSLRTVERVLQKFRRRLSQLINEHEDENTST